MFVCNIGRLDPARPFIERHASESYRLTRDDADVVQVCSLTILQIIHTDFHRF